MKKIYYYLLFLFGAQFLDVVLSALFPMDITLQTLSISFTFFFVSTLLISRRFDFISGLLILLIAGYVDGVRSFQIAELGVLLYFIVGTISIIWFKNMNDTLVSLMFILICSVFIREISLYYLAHILYHVSISFQKILLVRIIPTVLFSVIVCFIGLYADDYLDYSLEKREKMIKSNENLFFSNFKARYRK